MSETKGGGETTGKQVHLSCWVVTVFAALFCGWLCNRLALDSDLNWTVSMYWQKMAIAAQLEEPRRLLLLGGSGTHYSLDAMQMEQETGVHCVNMGLHGGLGLNAILAGVQGEVRKGDIVIVIPEYGILGGEGVGWLSGPFGVAISRLGIGGVGARQTVREILLGCSTNLTSFGKSIWRVLFGTAGRASLAVGERGGAVNFMEGAPLPGHITGKVSAHALGRLQMFDAALREVGATLLFAPPWLLIEDGDAESVAASGKVIEILGTIAPVLYDEKTLNLQTESALFSDTSYHLAPRGRSVATAALAGQLQTFKF